MLRDDNVAPRVYHVSRIEAEKAEWEEIVAHDQIFGKRRQRRAKKAKSGGT
ncbi:MAG: hypothetical protein ABIV23_04020 [Sphingomicrobium sp.]